MCKGWYVKKIVNLNTSKGLEMSGRYFNLTEMSSHNNVINFNIWRNVIISLFLSQSSRRQLNIFSSLITESFSSLCDSR